jgi:ATP-dependent Lon protease
VQDGEHYIIRNFPKQLKSNGFLPKDASHITITEPAVFHIVIHYTREAGVRSLELAIGGVVRYKAVECVEHLALAFQERGNMGTSDAIQRSEYDRVVEEHQLEKILGVARWDREEKRGRRGRGLL